MSDSYNNTKINRLKYKFSNCEKIVTNYSQAYQDMFVLSMLDGKRNGTFVEIGTLHPTDISNTYLLENEYDWRGISIDINPIAGYDQLRSSKLIVEDALKINYSQLFKDYGLPKHIDYLQLDIEPPINTLECLKLIPFDEYTFSIITFETDSYYSGNSISDISRKIFRDNNYEAIALDICNADINYPFEDWYVNPQFIDDKFIKLFKTNTDLKITAEQFILHE
jgi:hypothetical protein